MRALAYHHPRNADQLLLFTGEVAAEEQCGLHVVEMIFAAPRLLVKAQNVK